MACPGGCHKLEEVMEENTEQPVEAVAEVGQVPADAKDDLTVSAGDVAKIAALEAELSKYRDEAKKARDEAAARRIKAREESEAKIKALEEQQQFKALADERGQMLADLRAELDAIQPLTQKAKLWEQYEARKSEQIQARLPELPDQIRLAVENAPTLDLKRQILEAFDGVRMEASPPIAAKMTARPAPQAAQAEAPPPPFDPAAATPLDWANLKQQNPQRFAELTAVGRQSGKKSLFAQYADRLKR
jgi:hypothetical protein